MVRILAELDEVTSRSPGVRMVVDKRHSRMQLVIGMTENATGVGRVGFGNTDNYSNTPLWLAEFFAGAMKRWNNYSGRKRSAPTGQIITSHARG